MDLKTAIWIYIITLFILASALLYRESVSVPGTETKGNYSEKVKVQ